jgi:diacylglycerol kinase (ATP)
LGQTLSAKRASILYNPVARGLSRHRHLLQLTIETLRRQGIEGQLVATAGPGTAGSQARREIEHGAELIFAAGGDGTINEVASGMLNTGVPLAILPGGTANVLAREFRLPIHLDRAASLVSTFETAQISVGRARSQDGDPRVFLCMAGAGLDADIVSRVDVNLKAKTGKLAYYVSGFSNFFQPLTEFDVRVDGVAYRASFALVSRVRNYGGDLEIARHASLMRDDFEVVLFRVSDRMRYLPYLAAVALKQVHRLAGCTIVHGRTIECAGPDVWVQVDGELAGKLPVSLDLLPGALTMLLPPAYLAREQRYAAEAVLR